MTKVIVQVVALVVLLVILIIAIPLAWVWSANTLFGLAIPFSPKTWVAALILGSGLFARANYKLK